MITGYGCRNFRAFEHAELDVRPITILLGANGVGKTSILQIPLLLQQTAQSSNREYKSPLKIHGQSVSFGDPLNILYNHDITKNCGLSLCFENKEIRSLVNGRLLSEYQSYIAELGQYVHFQIVKGIDQGPLNKRFDQELIDTLRGTTRRAPKENDNVEAVIAAIKVVEADIDLNEWKSFRHTPFSLFGYGYNKKGLRKRVTADELLLTYEILLKIRSLNPREFRLDFEMAVVQTDTEIHKLEMRVLSLFFDDMLFISLTSGRNSKQVTVKSDIFTPDECRILSIELASCIDFKVSVFQCILTASNESGGDLRDIILTIMSRALSASAQSLRPDMVNHVAPLRAYPKRYYFLDVAAPGNIQGDSLVELLREDTKLQVDVNRWLNRFGISINVEQFREIIHRLAVTRDNLEFELDITDVGFGLSQVLPVVMQSYTAKQGSVTVIEQPEIHLHPNMQADLADLFLEVVSSISETNRPRFIIETHSEYLLNRLRRRIAERAISSDDVAIYFVERRPSVNGILTSQLRRVEISSGGAFEWPVEFFENTLEDTFQFLELQD